MSAAAFGVFLVCICAGLEGFAQVALKFAAEMPARRLIWIAAGAFLFLISALAYSVALRYLEVGVAYALDSLGLVSIALTSMWLLREKVTPIRWIGIGLIVAGVAMVAAQA
jgi:multidrug transporter EmrE-like cation transporter